MYTIHDFETRPCHLGARRHTRPTPLCGAPAIPDVWPGFSFAAGSVAAAGLRKDPLTHQSNKLQTSNYGHRDREKRKQ
jgi:hypothetical protein